MKNSASFFDKRIHLDQIGLADLICCEATLLVLYNMMEQRMIDYAERT